MFAFCVIYKTYKKYLLFLCPFQPLPAADPGEGPGGPGPPSFLDQSEAGKVENIFLETSPPLSQGLDDCPPPHLI